MVSVAPTATVERAALGQLQKLGDGGQGTVFFAPRVRFNGTMDGVYKEYKPQLRASINFSVLQAQTEFLNTLPSATRAALVERTSWPVHVVTDTGTPTGFVMPRIPSSFNVALRTSAGATSVTLASMQHLLNDPSFLRRRGLNFTVSNQYSLARELAEVLQQFHDNSIVVGDMSAKNVLFSLGSARQIYFIDADSMKVRGRSAVPETESPDWDVRSVSHEPLGTVFTDRYKFGLMVLRLLAGDQLTRSLSSLPAYVPSTVRQLLSESLSPDPSRRPSPAAWVPVLIHAATTAPLHAPAPGTTPAARPRAAAPTPPRRTSRGLLGLFTFTGRRNRRQWWLIWVVAPLATSALVALPGAAALLSLFGFWVLLACTAQRLHDMGRTGWWQLLYLVPLAGLPVFLWIGFSRGVKFANQFGPQP